MNNKIRDHAIFRDFQNRLAPILLSVLLATTWGLTSENEKTHTEALSLKLGTKAPDFTLQDSTGEKRNLSDFRGKKHVALVFYPALFRSGG